MTLSKGRVEDLELQIYLELDYSHHDEGWVRVRLYAWKLQEFIGYELGVLVVFL